MPGVAGAQVTAGLLGLACAVGCAVGFVVSTVRADAGLRASGVRDRTSTFTGWPRRWALAGTLLGIGSALWLAAAVLG